MPRFSPDGLRIAEYRRTWIDNHRTAQQECTHRCRVVLSDGTLIFDRGANIVAAGGGVVVAWEKHPEGAFDSLGRTFPRGVAGEVGPDGAICLKPEHESAGPYDVIERDGLRWRLSNEDVYGVQLLGGGKAICIGMDRQILSNVDAPYLPVSRPSVPGRLVWGARYANGIFLCQDIDTGCLTLDSRVIAPSRDTYYYYDLYWDGAQYKVIWSENQADEGVKQIAIYPHELEEKPLVGQTVPIEVPPINRELWVLFFDGNTSVPARRSPGNGVVAGRQITGPQDRPFIAAGGHDLTGLRLGTWVQIIETDDTVEGIETRARAVMNPVAYWDDREWPRWPVLPTQSWMCLQAYCRVNETPAMFEVDMRRILNGAPQGQTLALVAQCYTSNKNNTSDLRSLVPVYARLAKDYPAIAALLVFSGYGRATGYQDHPEVHDLWMSLIATVQMPTNGQELPVGSAGVTILDYDKKVSRRDPRGMLVRFDAYSDRPITKLEFRMDYDEPPLVVTFPPARGSDGRYFRGLCFKPVRTGQFGFSLKVWNDEGASGEAQSAGMVTVTEDPVDGNVLPPPTDGYPPELEDQLDLVKRVRRELAPDKYAPGHPDANADGYLPLNVDGHTNDEQGDQRTPTGTAYSTPSIVIANIAREIARRLKQYGVGVVRAKDGSKNNHDGLTGDIVALENGYHWDIAVDGGSRHYPRWHLDDDPNNRPPIKGRWQAV